MEEDLNEEDEDIGSDIENNCKNHGEMQERWQHNRRRRVDIPFELTIKV